MSYSRSPVRPKCRRRSVEYHTKRLLSAKANENDLQRNMVIMNKWQKAHSTDTLTKSWADVCVSSSCQTSLLALRDPQILRRRSLMPPINPNKERYRTGSLVAPNQSSMLQPPLGPKRESSMESGYLSGSHEGSNSTPNSPRSFRNGSRRRPVISQSMSEDDETTSSFQSQTFYNAKEKRSQFHA